MGYTFDDLPEGITFHSDGEEWEKRTCWEIDYDTDTDILLYNAISKKDGRESMFPLDMIVFVD